MKEQINYKNPSVLFPQSLPGFFKNLEPYDCAIESVNFLRNHKKLDIYILTAPSTRNPLSYLEKRIWIEEKFDYEFNIDESIIADEVEIPPMLVQPYIENSVWHGLRYKKSKGKLKVECIKKDNAVIFLIEDDGIGREKSQVIKTQNQKTEKSTGLKNIAERLAIINNLNNTNIQVEINNLDDSKEDCGTKVSIKIPTS